MADGKKGSTGPRHFNKGMRGVASGKSARRDLIAEIQRMLSLTDPWDAEKRCWADTLVQKLLWMAVYNGNGQGSISAAEVILAYMHGKPTQAIQLDANVVTTTQEEVADIAKSLAILRTVNDDDKPTGPVTVN
jgi:hypothetical protein